MSAFTTSFTGVRVVSKTTVAKKTVSTKACASMDFKKVRRSTREFARRRSLDRRSRATRGSIVATERAGRARRFARRRARVRERESSNFASRGRRARPRRARSRARRRRRSPTDDDDAT
jgi:hypothetical protein